MSYVYSFVCVPDVIMYPLDNFIPSLYGSFLFLILAHGLPSCESANSFDTTFSGDLDCYNTFSATLGRIGGDSRILELTEVCMSIRVNRTFLADSSLLNVLHHTFSSFP